MESLFQQQQRTNSVVYFVLVFCCTVFYYTMAYLKTDQSANNQNQRAQWYAHHTTSIRITQFILLSIALYLLLVFASEHLTQLLHLHTQEYLLLLIFPMVSLAYYGLPFPALARYNLRNLGWLKPLVIAFTWSGMVIVYPVFYIHILQQQHYQPDAFTAYLFLKNFMFITLLCIMFDIKDYAMDYNRQLKTWVVRLGLRKTIFYVLIPLSIAGLASYLGFAVLNHFSTWRMLFNTIPFVAAILVAYSLHHRRSIFYYLFIIDGLMILKAVCGILGMLIH